MPTTDDRDRYLSTPAAARYIGYAAGTLRNWRSQKQGPPFSLTPSGRARYRLTDLDAFLAAGLQSAEG